MTVLCLTEEESSKLMSSLPVNVDMCENGKNTRNGWPGRRLRSKQEASLSMSATRRNTFSGKSGKGRLAGAAAGKSGKRRKGLNRKDS